MEKTYSLDSYDFHFPKELIAQEPLQDRSSSRLMTVDRVSGKISHMKFTDIAGLMNAGDCLVINDTRVIPANLEGTSAKTGAVISVLVLDNISGNRWNVLMKNSRRLSAGDAVLFPGGINLTLVKKKGRIVEAEFNCPPGELTRRLWQAGTMPLPPYIKNNPRGENHRSRYQTVYAEKDGAKAAPTAGLHFTPEIISGLMQKGVMTPRVTLHVGLGTFESIETADIRDHHMHSEFIEITEESAAAINSCRSKGGRIIAVGTTTMRTLESSVTGGGIIMPCRKDTSIFIYPGHKFNAVDAMITNFHQPRTSLFVLVCAFAGYDLMHRAYSEAIKERYRLFSYGDAMMII
ncbi:MAG: tRNA preQ1(34) S-adenosylmethionine ribosyltransferase-isomerase QueA [Spirochaetia bacterium]|nr:tRNA preQ1(34) S-adenosylmethionine ribosyltransferase-isomerase QueA [Spirochaetia bacterium]